MHEFLATQIAKFMGPTWGSPGSCRTQIGPMLAPWTLLSGYLWWVVCCGLWPVCLQSIFHVESILFACITLSWTIPIPHPICNISNPFYYRNYSVWSVSNCNLALDNIGNRWLQISTQCDLVKHSCHFAEDIFKTSGIEIKIAHVDSILPKLDFGGPIDNKSTLFQVITLCQKGDKPLPKPMMI